MIRYEEYLKPIHWQWQKSFAWKPIKVRSGATNPFDTSIRESSYKWVWLRTVYTKNSITITASELIQRKLSGEN